MTCITSIKGDKIEEWAITGEQPDDRRSPWLWPRIEKPPSNFWTVWRRMLRSTVIVPGGDALRQPIGDWLTQPQQEWLHTYDTDNNVLVENYSKDKVRIYEATTLKTRNKLSFINTSQEQPRRSASGVPATVYHNGQTLIAITRPSISEEKYNDPTSFSEHVHRQPTYIKRLIATKDINEHAENLAHNPQAGTILIAGSDATVQNKVGTFAWLME